MNNLRLHQLFTQQTFLSTEGALHKSCNNDWRFLAPLGMTTLLKSTWGEEVAIRRRISQNVNCLVLK
jgi:hypothetical protein